MNMLTEFIELPAVHVGDVLLKLDMSEPSPLTRNVARLELRETPETRKQAVEDLRKLLALEKDLQSPSENEAWLLHFLRPCKFYAESARDLIVRYYKFKVQHVQVYAGLVPSRESNVFQQNILTVFPQRDQLGRRIFLLELGKRWKHKELSLDEVYKGTVLLLEAFLLEPETQINGAIGIYDMAGLSLPQTMHVTPSIAKRIVDCFQDAAPLRLKALHIVNQSKIFNVIFALIKPYLRKKLASRIHFHGSDRQSLHRHVAPQCLPPVYGGTQQAARIDGTHWHQLLLQYEPEFQAINSYGYSCQS